MRNLLAKVGLGTSSYKIKAVEYPYSPDVARLEQREHWLYFSYMPELDKHEGVVIDAFTADRLTMWRMNAGRNSFPIPVTHNPVTQGLPHYPIRGKLLLLSPATIMQLDAFAKNGECFVRNRVDINYTDIVQVEARDRDVVSLLGGRDLPYHLPHHRPGMNGSHGTVSVPVTHKVKAWMHVGNDKHWMLPTSIKGKLYTRDRDGLEGRYLSSVSVRNGQNDAYLLSLVKRYRLNKSDPYYLYNHEVEVNERK